MSQQGPFYGQVGWFNVLHPEKLPSVQDRYTKQCERVLGVLDVALEGKDWLVGDKCTYADLAFYMWNVVPPLSIMYPPRETPLAKFPDVMAWHERMGEREAVKKVVGIRQGMMDSEGLGVDALPTDVSVEDLTKGIMAKE